MNCVNANLFTKLNLFTCRDDHDRGSKRSDDWITQCAVAICGVNNYYPLSMNCVNANLFTKLNLFTCRDDVTFKNLFFHLIVVPLFFVCFWLELLNCSANGVYKRRKNTN